MDLSIEEISVYMQEHVDAFSFGGYIPSQLRYLECLNLRQNQNIIRGNNYI